MSLKLELPKKSNIKPSITVIGVGGAGGNAVNNMVSSGMEGIKYVVANTDAQSLDNSLCDSRIQLGETITQGLGAGSYPEVGKAAAEEAADAIIDAIQDANMVFIAAGMGGGTGTGATPVIARLAREQGLLTVAVVTKPFHFEGSHRMRVAELGLQELQKYVDTLVVIPNQNLFRVADKSTTFADAFKMADNVLSSGIRGITDLMVMPGLINLDFADIRTIMGEMGKAMIGAGEAEGENRAAEAAEAAISNPLLDNVSMKGARGVLINITGGPDLTLFEVDEAANRIKEEVDPNAKIIFGSSFNSDAQGKIRVSIVATGIENEGEGQFESAQSAATQAARQAPIVPSRNDSAVAEAIRKEQGVEAARGSYYTEPLEPEYSEEDQAQEEEAASLSVAAGGPFSSQRNDAAAQKRAAGNAGMGFLGRFSRGNAPAEEETQQEEEAASIPAFSARPRREAPVLKQESDRELETVSAAPEAKSPEDLLDIPAFLRRKNT